MVRPVEKISADTEKHYSSKSSLTKTTLKSGKSQSSQQQGQELAQQQLQQLQQQQLQQLQQQQLLQQQQQQQQIENEQQQQEEQQEQEYYDQDQVNNEQEEGEVYDEEQEQNEEGDQDQEDVYEEKDHVLPNGRTLNEEFLKIEMKKLELKELELRRTEIRDLEQRRNELLKAITILRRRGYSTEPIRTLNSISSRPSSVESIYRSEASRSQDHSSLKKSVPKVTARPPAPSNYQNDSGVIHHQPSTRTIAQVTPKTRNRTVREISNTGYEPESQTEFEKQLNLPTKSKWLNHVQNQTNQIWMSGGAFQNQTPFSGQQFQNFQLNNQQNAAQQPLSKNFGQLAMQQVPNTNFGQFGSRPALVPQVSDQLFDQNKTVAQSFAQNQNFNQNLSQFNQASFANQFQQPQVQQMGSSLNFPTSKNYF